MLQLLDAHAYDRLRFFLSFSVEDNSSIARLAAATYAFQDFMSHPWVGTGLGNAIRLSPGSSDTIGSHNMYLSLLQQHGIVGIVLICIFAISLMDRVRGETRVLRSTFLMAFAIAAIFSHNIIGDRPTNLAVMVLATWIAVERKEPVHSTRETRGVSDNGRLPA